MKQHLLLTVDGVGTVHAFRDATGDEASVSRLGIWAIRSGSDTWTAIDPGLYVNSPAVDAAVEKWAEVRDVLVDRAPRTATRFAR